MAGRQNLTTFESNAAEFVTFHKTSSTTAPFAQVQSWQWKAERVINTKQRVSDAAEYDTITALRASGSVNFFYKKDPKEVAALLGVTKPTSGGWTGSESITLASTFSDQATYVMVAWSATATASASVTSVTTITNLRVIDWDFDATGGADLKQTVNWRADTVAMVPVAGLGSTE